MRRLGGLLRNVAYLASLGAMLWALAWYGQLRVARAVDDGRRMAESDLDEQGRLRPVADVMALTRALKLVTVQVDTTVCSSSLDSSWRGSVCVIVTAPARYHYGVDLAELRDDALHLDAEARQYRLKIPHPTRVAIEVDRRHCDETIEVTGTRLRSRAGEYFLGLAQKALDEEAARQTLSPRDMERVEQLTLEQVRELVSAFVGPEASIEVTFE